MSAAAARRAVVGWLAVGFTLVTLHQCDSSVIPALAAGIPLSSAPELRKRLGRAVGMLRRVAALVVAWVPACAGMTEGGRRNDGRGRVGEAATMLGC